MQRFEIAIRRFKNGQTVDLPMSPDGGATFEEFPAYAARIKAAGGEMVTRPV